MEKIVEFPDRKYRFCLEKNTLGKLDLEFPQSVKDKTLFITGVPGTGKSTLGKDLCAAGGVNYNGQAFIIFNESFKVYRYNGFRGPSLNNYLSHKIIEGHFMFQGFATNPVFSHSEKICKKDYANLVLKKLSAIPKVFKNNLLFEFRQFSPEEIHKARLKRYELESSENLSWCSHTFRDQKNGEIEKELFMLYQAARILHDAGADVYFRFDFDGAPWRFAE